MNIELKKSRPESVEADILVLGLKAGAPYSAPLKHLNTLLKGELGRELERRGFQGKLGSSLLMPTYGAIMPRNVLLFGLGEEVNAEAMRLMADGAVGAARSSRARVVAVAQESSGRPEVNLAALAEGAELAGYRFTSFKSRSEEAELASLQVLASSEDARMARALEMGRRLAAATNLARDLINTPAEEATPEYLGDAARTLAARNELECDVYGRRGIEALKMGALLGVAKGSPREPCFIVLRYKPPRASPHHLALVGKGITFDSGGLNLKPAASMEEQKRDMTGAAVMMAVMSELAHFKPPIEIRAYMPCTENMVGSNATKPGDVLRSRLGKTIEVLNTDAEGRLVLADALAYACEARPRSVIDAGTLTAAVRSALGTRVAGIMGNDPALVGKLRDAGEAAGERLWELPLVAEYADELRSNVADLRNIGTSGNAGSIVCGLFLKEFVSCRSWAHIDMSGVAFTQRAMPLTPPGAVGFGVRTLIRYLLAQ